MYLLYLQSDCSCEGKNTSLPHRVSGLANMRKVPLISVGAEVRQSSHLNHMLSTLWLCRFTFGCKAFFLFFLSSSQVAHILRLLLYGFVKRVAGMVMLYNLYSKTIISQEFLKFQGWLYGRELATREICRGFQKQATTRGNIKTERREILEK